MCFFQFTSIMSGKRIILLNGPPSCGKDSIAQRYIELVDPNACTIKFAQPIRDAAMATFPHLNQRNFEQNKSLPIYPQSEATLRDWMIRFSEVLMKPLLGQSIFGAIATEKINNLEHSGTILVTDCGFLEELMYLLDNSEYSMLLVKIRRKGTNFVNDSRSYLSPPEHHPRLVVCTLDNNDTLDAAALQLAEHAHQINS